MKKARSKSALFLTELIIIILFFSICSAMCVQIFAATAKETRYSSEANGALTKVQNAAELVKATSADLSSIADTLGGTAESDRLLKIYYDKHWQGTDKNRCAYIMTVSVDKNGETVHILIDKKGGEEIISQKIVYHTPKLKGGR